MKALGCAVSVHVYNALIATLERANQWDQVPPPHTFRNKMHHVPPYKLGIWAEEDVVSLEKAYHWRVFLYPVRAYLKAQMLFLCDHLHLEVGFLPNRKLSLYSHMSRSPVLPLGVILARTPILLAFTSISRLIS